MAEDIVASHPLLMTTAVLSGEYVEKLEILQKQLFLLIRERERNIAAYKVTLYMATIYIYIHV